MTIDRRTVEVSTTAFLDDADNMNIPNIVHSNEGARRFGFRAAIIAGTTVYGWAVPALLQLFGTAWLDNGWHDLRFRRPVYPGDEITTRIAERDGGAFDLTILDPGGQGAVVGQVGLGPAPWLSELHDSARRTAEPQLERVPELTIENAPVGQDLRPLATPVTADDASRYAREIQKDLDPLWTGTRPRLHPGWIAYRMWPFIRHSVRLGPIIHTRSQIQHLAPALSDQTLTTTGHFVEAYERKGHHYFVTDGCITGEDGTDLARFRHTTIFKIGSLA